MARQLIREVGRMPDRSLSLGQGAADSLFYSRRWEAPVCAGARLFETPASVFARAALSVLSGGSAGLDGIP